MRGIRVCGRGLSLAVAAIALAMPALSATIAFDLINFGSHNSDVDLTVEDVAGGVQVSAYLNISPNTGDLIGLFFSVEDLVAPLTFTSVSGAPVTASQVSANGVSNLGGGNNVNPRGAFDIGVALGQNGIGRGDDFQSSVFRILGNISAESFVEAAARVQSVGLPGSGRSGSSKLFSNLPMLVGGDPPPPAVPEPSTYVLMGSALAALAIVHSRRKRRSTSKAILQNEPEDNQRFQ